MNNARKCWTEEQDKALNQEVKRLGLKSWAAIAGNLDKVFGVSRTGKQCRQRWHNHLNPGIEKKSWTKKEEECLFELHRIHGNKWTVITQSLPGRTDNAIKNYFYSTIRRSLRRIGKFLGSKNSTVQMKQIKPSTLSKIFAADSQLNIQDFQTPQEQNLIRYIREHSQMVRSYIIKFTSYKPKKTEKADMAEKSQLEEVIKKMIFINNTYESLKQENLLKKKDEENIKIQGSRNMESQSDADADNDSSESIIVKEEAKSEEFYNRKKEKVFHIKKEQKTPNNTNYQLIKQEATSESPKRQYMQRKVPTATMKNEEDYNQKQLGSIFDLPEFAVDLKEEGEEVPQYMQKENLDLKSPGFFFTPSHNPFTYFYSPSTPQSSIDSLSSSFGVLHHNTLDEFQMMIQRQIENNLKGEPKISRATNNSTTTIGTSPGSAFSSYI